MQSQSWKAAVLAVLGCAPLTPALGNEISISLTATVEPRCEVVDVVSSGLDLPGLGSPFFASASLVPSDFVEVTVSCNTPQFQVSLVGSEGPVPVQLLRTIGPVGSVGNAANSIAVAPRRPGLFVLDLELEEGSSNNIQVQLNSF